jgi:hypothetical protein
VSTTTSNSSSSYLSAAPEGPTQYDRVIERQLDRTRRHVKVVDLFTALMLLAAGVLGCLLVVAVIDHWVLGLGTVGRYLVWFVLLAAVAGYFAGVLVPLLFLTINPLYAARVIEQSDPSLKNSLVNFLLFRFDRAGLRAAIYQALQQRAAADLAHVEVDTAVDRSPLIRVGYLLAAVLTACAVYTILSPKNTLASAARVIAPWSDIARPARVRIADVQPGSRQVFHGEEVPVTVAVYDLRQGEPVTLFYSSLDGRVTKQPVPMPGAADGLMHTGRLSPNGEGVRQDLVYWIEAGDAITPAYRLTVVPAPTIVVEQVHYQYPRYTRLPAQTIERQGDIHGVEGTQVTVRARANLPIRSAVLEFDPTEATGGAANEPGNGGGRTGTGSARMLDMAVDGLTARCSFALEMDPSRTRSLYAWYQIRFVTDEGQRNPQPALHRISVSRDLAPEIEILVPNRQRVELPLDASQPIEVRAIDPDFGLAAIRLKAVAGGGEILDQRLLDEPAGATGQQIVKTLFEPAKLRLSPGDRVELWAVAEDNRQPSDGGPPDPNVVKTGNYQIVILPPEKSVLRPAEKPAAKPAEQPGAQQPKSDTADRPPERRPSDPPSPKPGGDKGADQPQAGKNGSDPEKGKGGQSSGDSGGAGGQKTEAGSGTQEPRGGQPQSQSSGSESGSAGASPSPKSADGASQSESGSSSGSGPQQQPSVGGQSGSGQQQGSSGGTSAGGQKQASSGGQSNAGQESAAAGSDAAEAGQESGSREPLHDGDVFEKTLEHMQQQAGGKDATGGQASKTGNDASASQEGSGQSTAKQPDGAPQAPRPNQAGDQPGQSPEATGKQDTQAKSGGESPESPQQGQKGPSGGDSGQQQPDKNQGGGEQQKSGAGAGGEPKGPAETNKAEKPQSGGADEPKQPGNSDTGESGKGQNSSDKSGSSGSMEQNRDKQKSGGAGGSTPKPNTEPQAPSLSKRQSDSGGKAGGDKSGGAKQGGGQGANQPGNDSPGSNSAADDGAGAATESGAGDKTQAAGNKEQTSEATGAAGEEKGPGSSSRPAATEQPGGGLTTSTGSAGSKPQTAPINQGQPAQKGAKGRPMGGGVPGEADFQNNLPSNGAVPPGEEANLQYTRKATDMVLEYLRNQQRKPDQELLDKLGWTADDLQQFLRRWETLKRSAREDAAARRELEETLRSLGLRPATERARNVNARSDQVRGMRETGGSSSPPPGYLEQFNAYKKATTRTVRE